MSMNRGNPKRVRSEPTRKYIDIGSFEIRYGKFYNYNPTVQPDKMEIRITSTDFELSDALLEKIIEWLEPKQDGGSIA